MKGAYIADGCVIARRSVVLGEFMKPNCLIAGIPAVIKREDISWEK
jgi:acetyltransferase-like isoleucine patch superfamily enzyme